jgi:nucleoside phosphorylase
MTIIVPRGAEEAAVRRGAPGATVVAIAAAAGSAALPPAIDARAPVVLAGLCGALTAARVGDVVIYTSIVDESGTETLAAAEIARAQTALPHARPVVAVMADRVITTAVERTALAARFGAGVVDMEAMHVARALRARGVAFAMVRVVSDDPRADLPPIEHAFDPSGGIRPLALALAFARAPVAAARFVRDVQASLRVLSSTAAALAAVK